MDVLKLFRVQDLGDLAFVISVIQHELVIVGVKG